MHSNTPANTSYKDSFFTKLFSEPESILNLYNALSDSHYTSDTPIEITTLENVLYKDRYNDLSFIIDGKLVVLVEHQASINPNMPTRLLIYLARVYDQHVKGKNIYSSRLVKLPRPEFIVLYNGQEAYPDETILKLSDAFVDLPEGHKVSGSLELTVRVLNINKGHNEAIVHESAELDGYVVIVDEIRKNKESGMSLEDAVAKAVKECADRDILRDFLEKYGGEIINMLYAEWNLDEYVALVKREAAEDAAAQAIEKTRAEERKAAIKVVAQARDEERKAAIKIVEQARNEERKAAKQANTQAKCDTAKKALAKGISPEDVAEIADLPIEEVKALVKHY